MKRLLLAAWLALSLAAAADPQATLRQLLDCLNDDGRASAPPLVGARWEVQHGMVRRLLEGDGTLDDLFAYYLVTRREVVPSQLDTASKSTWGRLVHLMGQLALETGHQAGAGMVLPARAQAALEAARRVRAEAPAEAEPETVALLDSLVAALEHLVAGVPDEEELIRLRRRWSARRARLGLAPARTWELDSALDALDL